MVEPDVRSTKHASAKARVVAVIGASSGIGRSVALLGADAGDELILMARRKELLEGLAEEVAVRRTTATDGRDRALRKPVVVAADVREEESARYLVEAAVGTYGRLDVIVYAAGWNVPKRAIGEATTDSWNLILGTNVTGAFLVTNAAVPVMRQQGNGLFVFVSSSGAKRPDRSGAAYQASKAALAALAHATMEEAREDGIRTTVVYPGITDTPFLDHRPVPADAETRNRALKPDDVARAVRFVIDLPARAHVPELLMYPSRN